MKLMYENLQKFNVLTNNRVPNDVNLSLVKSVDVDNNGGLWMVLGRNGHGKSTLIDIPKIAYYGKRNGFKKEDIANRMKAKGLQKLKFYCQNSARRVCAQVICYSK